MRLLVITREFPPYIAGGLSYHLVNLYSEIAGMGHDITILAGRPRSIDRTSSVSVPEKLNVHWADYYTLSAYHLQFPVMLRRKLRDFDIGAFDVALTHTEVPFSIGIPTIQKIHDAKHVTRWYNRQKMTSVRRIMDSCLQPSRQWVTQRSIDSADGVIFNSGLTKEVWNEAYNLPDHTEIIYNGVDTEIFYPQPSHSEDYVLFVGDSPRKGLPKVREFAADAAAPVYVVGDVENTCSINSVGRLSQDKLAEYYSSALVTIHPARFEAFGNVILESLACGTPVVISDRCGAAEIVDSTCGRITSNIEKGIEEARTLDEQACVNKASSHSWRNVGKRTIEFINSTLNRNCN